VDLGGLGPESMIQRISGFHLKFTGSHFHLNVTLLCKLSRIRMWHVRSLVISLQEMSQNGHSC